MGVTVTAGERQMPSRVDDVPLDLIEQVGRSVVEMVGEIAPDVASLEPDGRSCTPDDGLAVRHRRGP